MACDRAEELVRRYTYRVEIAYRGAAFGGSQRQVGVRTVESVLMDALHPLASISRIAAGGRTDRGVSATGQVISFWSRDRIGLDAIGFAIDREAPADLAVLDVREVGRSFHARFSACSRHYVYRTGVDSTIDVRRLDRLLQALVGRRCFSAFARDVPRGKTTVRTLFRASARWEGELVRFDLSADGFLRHQVRVLIATAIRETRSQLADDALAKIAESGDRTRAAWAAPAEGLTLVRVGYDARAG
jgi:tRNA pseudouridine38-40 synthase